MRPVDPLFKLLDGIAAAAEAPLPEPPPEPVAKPPDPDPPLGPPPPGLPYWGAVYPHQRSGMP